MTREVVESALTHGGFRVIDVVHGRQGCMWSVCRRRLERPENVRWEGPLRIRSLRVLSRHGEVCLSGKYFFLRYTFVGLFARFPRGP